MSCFIVNGMIADANKIPELFRRAQFRKATENMLLTYSALEDLFKVSPDFMSNFRHEMGIILGTSHGELEVSKEFLKHIAFQNVARPILFQNSLHNSTLGFLTLQFGLTGPGLTLSHQYFSGEDSLGTAKLLLDEKQCSFCVVVALDTLVPELEPVRDIIYPKGLKRKAGCAAILLANADGLKKLHDANALAILEDIEYDRNRRTLSQSEVEDRIPPGYYDADAVENLILALNSSFDTSPLTLWKPDGSRSRLAFRRL